MRNYKPTILYYLSYCDKLGKGGALSDRGDVRIAHLSNTFILLYFPEPADGVVDCEYRHLSCDA